MITNSWKSSVKVTNYEHASRVLPSPNKGAREPNIGDLNQSEIIKYVVYLICYK